MYFNTKNYLKNTYNHTANTLLNSAEYHIILYNHEKLYCFASKKIKEASVLTGVASWMLWGAQKETKNTQI
jgi:hypothetical protein